MNARQAILVERIAFTEGKRTKEVTESDIVVGNKTFHLVELCQMGSIGSFISAENYKQMRIESIVEQYLKTRSIENIFAGLNPPG